jgi:D-methionine transport system ATP-binding protein
MVSVSLGSERIPNRYALPFGSAHDAFGFIDGLTPAHPGPTGYVQTGIVSRSPGFDDERYKAHVGQTMLRLTDVAKRFGAVVAIDGISLEVKRGEILGIIGRSGAGKSTLIRCLNGLEKPDSGSVEILGQDIAPLGERELREVRGRIGMIFQHFNLLSSKTVADNVALPLKIAGKPRNERRARVAELLELVGLADKASFYPAQLSGGQKQRVGIARALAAEPALLLSDEATSALDPETTASILALLRDINRKLGLTIVLITHEMNVIRAIADHVVFLDQGRVAEQGATAGVFANPRAEITRRLLASANHARPEAVAEVREFAPHWGAAWTPGLNTVFRVTLEGELASRPLLADLTSATGARPIILKAETSLRPEGAATTICFSVDGAAPELAARINRYLTRAGASVEIFGHAQPSL